MTCRSAIGRAGRERLPDFLQRIQAGDETAARELLQRYEAEVRLVVRRQLPRLLRSRFDSLDFLQSVWGSFFRRIRTGPTEFEDSRHLVAFLARAAKNKVIDEYRRAASRSRTCTARSRSGATAAVPGSSPPDSTRRARSPRPARPSAGSATCFPRSDGPILELKAEGLSSKEIGERLGISERTVQRVLEDLRRRMESEWEARG